MSDSAFSRLVFVAAVNLTGCTGEPSVGTEPLGDAGQRDAALECRRSDAGPCDPSFPQTECEGLGGIYLKLPMRQPWCACPASDRGCPCTTSLECEIACVGRHIEGTAFLCEPAFECFGYTVLWGSQCIGGPWPQSTGWWHVGPGLTNSILFE